MLGPVHRTEATAVEAATQRGLQDEAVGFGGWPPERHVVVDQHGGLFGRPGVRRQLAYHQFVARYVTLEQ